MKIETINIKNFKGIESLEAQPHGKNVYLIGGNGAGKTSFIDAIFYGLTGKNLASQPTYNNKKNGLIEIDLGDFIARTKLNNSGRPSKFELENKDYTKENERFIKSPRSYMESRIGLLNFDIEAFFNLSEKEQVKYFAKLVDADFSDIDANIEELMESRRFDKRELKNLEPRVGYYQDEDADREPIDVVKLSRKIAEETERKNQFDRVSDGVQDRKAKISELQAQIDELKSQVTDGDNWLADAANKPLEASEMQKLNDELENSNQINEKIAEAKEARQVEKAVEDLRKGIEEQTEAIDEQRAEKAKRLAQKITVDGLEYDTNGERFLYNGLPFEKNQINTAAQLIAGMKIASSTLKDLKILRVDGSLIDKDNFDEVVAWAGENDIELFVELVDRDGGKLEVVIHDENE